MTVSEKNELFKHSIWYSSDGSIDLDRYLNSEYGTELMRRISIRSEIEDSYEAAERFYESIGLKVQVFEDDDYYTRWKLFSPINAGSEKLPLIFYLHGGGISIEGEEYVTGLADLAAKEKFLLCIPQNTNWENVERLIDALASMQNVDRERVYVGGFSQGSTQTSSAMYRLPHKIAACCIACGDVYRPYDGHQVYFTPEEEERLHKLKMPTVIVCGRSEPSCYAPLNDWHPRTTPPFDSTQPHGTPDTFNHPGRDDNRDPTRILTEGVGYRDPNFGGIQINRKWSMAKPYAPNEGEDRHVWAINKVNHRMDSFDIERRDMDTCLSYLELDKDDLHRIVGIYGDRERIDTYYGVNHYTLDFDDNLGRNTLRYIVVDNAPHFPPVAMGEIMWNYCKDYRRDLTTGTIKIVK